MRGRATGRPSSLDSGPVAVVRLRPPLRERADGRPEISVEGATVEEALRGLERAHPKLAGWVLDDQGRVREHVAVFVGGERVDGGAKITDADRLEIVGAVSGGAGVREAQEASAKA